jgi:hypothetical protein
MVRQLSWSWWLVFSVLLAACGFSGAATNTPNAPGNKPSLFLIMPKDGDEVGLGSEVEIQTLSTDTRGVVRVELHTDGFLYRADITPNNDGMPNLRVTQTWPAKELGVHVIIVKAINRDGIASDEVKFNLKVVPQTALRVTVTPVPQTQVSNTPAAQTPATVSTPNTTVAPTASPTSSGPCEPNAVFVSDVTVPDGTPVKPSEIITKIWRVRNTGNCVWDATYQIVFNDGSQMDANAEQALPPTPSGTTADIAVKLTAPKAAAIYIGKWRLRAPNGTLFGQALLVAVRVVDPNAPTPTPVRPTVAPSATPTIKGPASLSFTVDRAKIPYGECVTLKWDVDNVIAVKLDGKGVTGHDTRSVCPTETTEYKLQAVIGEGSDPLEKVLTIEVDSIASTGTRNVTAGNAIDLDTGDIIVIDSDAQWTGGQWVPKNGATFAVMGARTFTDVTKDSCAKAPNYSGNTLSSSQLTGGVVLCYKTNAGRFGKLRVESVDADIRVRWVTW